MPILVIAVLGALIPTALYVLFVWWLDPYEKEPPWLLALAFLWGAGPAAFLSLAFERLVAPVFFNLSVEAWAASLMAVSIGAPFVEESLKGIALVGLVFIFYHEFDDVLDGIIYGAMIGFGFALTENIFGYFLPILRGGTLSTGLPFILLRTVVFGANHAFWTGITGAAVGYARLSHDRRRRLPIAIAGWTLAVLFHSLHNIGTSLVRLDICIPLGVSLIVDWGGLLLLLLVAFVALRRECRWIEEGLVAEVSRGLLTEEEYDILRSARLRLRVQLRAYMHGGRRASRAVGRYFQAATELAFRRRHLRAAGRPGTDDDEIERLQREVAERRERAWPWLGAG